MFSYETGKASFHSFLATFQSLNDNAGVSRVITRSVAGTVQRKCWTIIRGWMLIRHGKRWSGLFLIWVSER